MKIKNWIACVQDRGKWKDVVEKAKTFNHSRKFKKRKKPSAESNAVALFEA